MSCYSNLKINITAQCYLNQLYSLESKTSSVKSKPENAQRFSSEKLRHKKPEAESLPSDR